MVKGKIKGNIKGKINKRKNKRKSLMVKDLRLKRTIFWDGRPVVLRKRTNLRYL